MAEGTRQSPIDIDPHQASHDPNLGPIVLNYDHCTSINISNNGHSVVVEFDDSDDRSGEKMCVCVCICVSMDLQLWFLQTVEFKKVKTNQ